jgi:hypothetical protein
MQLALGTVQFGLDYGIANQAGQVELSAMQQILSQAWHNNINVLDTAQAYGNAETRIGDYCQHHPDQAFKIVTKLSGASANNISLSLQRLQQHKIYALLLHNIDDLQKSGHSHLWQSLCDLKMQGTICKLGASIYHPQDIDFLLENFDIDVIQLPLNIFDQRVLASGQLQRLQQRNIEIHIRSVFLQGLLLMPFELAAQKHPPATKALQQFHAYCDDHQLTPLSACLQFIHQQSAISQVIIGAQTLAQLNEILGAWQTAKNAAPMDFSWCSQSDLAIIDPSRWHS